MEVNLQQLMSDRVWAGQKQIICKCGVELQSKHFKVLCGFYSHHQEPTGVKEYNGSSFGNQSSLLSGAVNNVNDQVRVEGGTKCNMATACPHPNYCCQVKAMQDLSVNTPGIH